MWIREIRNVVEIVIKIIFQLILNLIITSKHLTIKQTFHMILIYISLCLSKVFILEFYCFSWKKKRNTTLSYRNQPLWHTNVYVSWCIFIDYFYNSLGEFWVILCLKASEVFSVSAIKWHRIIVRDMYIFPLVI